MIKFFGLDRQYASLREEILHATDEVLTSGKVLDGPWCSRFESAIASRTNREYAVAVNSCSQALLFSYLAHTMTNGRNPRVAVPTVSFAATANAPKLAGHSLKFIDVDLNGMMDLDQLDIKRDHINIVSYVNLFGNILDYDKLRLITGFFNDEITIIEDAAQSFGATYKGIPSGKLGDISCLSFDPTKNLPNYGSGGMLLTDDVEIHTLARNLRDNGKITMHTDLGTNSKMSEVDCAHMMIKLKYFDQWQERRTKIAEYYNDCLHPYADCPHPNPDVVHAWHKYVIQIPDQYALDRFLKDQGVETKIHYSASLPSMPAFNNDVDCDYPVANKLANTSLSLPIYPELTDAEVEHVVKTIQEFYD